MWYVCGVRVWFVFGDVSVCGVDCVCGLVRRCVVMSLFVVCEWCSVLYVLLCDCGLCVFLWCVYRMFVLRLGCDVIYLCLIYVLGVCFLCGFLRWRCVV